MNKPYPVVHSDVGVLPKLLDCGLNGLKASVEGAAEHISHRRVYFCHCDGQFFGLPHAISGQRHVVGNFRWRGGIGVIFACGGVEGVTYPKLH